MNSMTIFALGPELNRTLKNSRLERAVRYPGGLTFVLRGAPFRYFHVLVLKREVEIIVSEDEIVPLGDMPACLDQAAGAEIHAVESNGLNRILFIRCSRGGAWSSRTELTIRIDCKPSRMPVSLIDGKTGGIIDSTGAGVSRKPRRIMDTSSRKPLSILSLPENPPGDMTLDANGDIRLEKLPAHTRIWERARRASGLILRHIDGLDPVLARVLSRAREGDIESIWQDLLSIGNELTSGRFIWRLYDFPEEGEAGRCAVYPVELPVEAKAQRCTGFFDALSKRGASVIIPRYIRALKDAVISSANRDLRKARRLKTNLSHDLEEAQRSKEYRYYGNLLATYRHLLKTGLDKITVKDFSGDATVTVPLDPSRTPDKNIRSYFNRAKKGEKGLIIIMNRKRTVERKIDEAKTFIDRITDLTKPAELLRLLTPDGDSARNAKTAQRRQLFRSFVLDASHTAYVGRNDRENDRLTHRFASPRDIWFHAQGIKGSHVILKGATPSTPKRILEAAASVAAFFSKARHSTTVPVVYTEKRYVRKPKKSPPGTVIYHRGKTLFVSPVLPEKTAGG